MCCSAVILPPSALEQLSKLLLFYILHVLTRVVVSCLSGVSVVVIVTVKRTTVGLVTHEW